MIPKKDLDKARDLARKYGASKLYVFGSSLIKEPEKVNDYDFAVVDIPPASFFEFYGKLLMAMPKNVDLVDLSGKKDKFKNIIIKEGKIVYDKSSA